MNHDQDGAAQEREQRIKEIKRQRFERDRSAIEAALNEARYERIELRREFRHAQEVYVKKLEKFNNLAMNILDTERKIWRKLAKLLEDNGKCSAFSHSLIGPKDSGHAFHACELEFGHAERHKCACNSKFTVDAAPRENIVTPTTTE